MFGVLSWRISPTSIAFVDTDEGMFRAFERFFDYPTKLFAKLSVRNRGIKSGEVISPDIFRIFL